MKSKQLLLMAKRANHLSNLPLDDLRSLYPEETATGAELIKLCKDRRLTRGDMIEAILIEEFYVDE